MSLWKTSLEPHPPPHRHQGDSRQCTTSVVLDGLNDKITMNPRVASPGTTFTQRMNKPMRKIPSSVHSTFIWTFVLALALLIPAPRAHAVSKEIIQLQTQVQQLQDALQHLQDTNDARMAVLQHLIEQTSDNVNHIGQSMNAIQQQLSSDNQSNQVSGQIQSLNDSVDELKTRLNQVNTTLQAIQSQLQNIQSQPAQQQPAAQPCQPGQPCPTPQTGGPQQPAQPQAPPVDQLYQSALTDYNGARYDLAGGEFQQLLQAYPQDNLAPNAIFYLGEIAFRKGDYANAITTWDQVLEQYPGSNKAPAAQLRKGEAEMRANQRDAAVRDFRSLVQRYPQSPEAQQARSHLNAMGVRVNPTKPTAYR